MRLADPLMYPPRQANALASVPSMTSMRSMAPSRADTPAPRGPYIPTAWTSSQYVIAAYRSARSQMRWIGATSPSIEYRLSNTISLGRAGSDAASSASRCATSLWRQICFSEPDWRMPSIIELWLDASDRMRQLGISLAIVEIPAVLET